MMDEITNIINSRSYNMITKEKISVYKLIN